MGPVYPPYLLFLNKAYSPFGKRKFRFRYFVILPLTPLKNMENTPSFWFENPADFRVWKNSWKNGKTHLII